MIIGNDATGLWKKASASPTPPASSALSRACSTTRVMARGSAHVCGRGPDGIEREAVARAQLPLTLALLVSAGHNAEGHAAGTQRRADIRGERRGKDIYFGLATTIKARRHAADRGIGRAAGLRKLSWQRRAWQNGRRRRDVGHHVCALTALRRQPSKRQDAPTVHGAAAGARRLLGIDPAGNPLHAAMPRFRRCHTPTSTR